MHLCFSLAHFSLRKSYIDNIQLRLQDVNASVHNIAGDGESFEKNVSFD